MAPSPAQAGAWDCKSSAYACTPGYTGSNASSTWAWTYYGASIAQTTTGHHNCTLYAAHRLAQARLANPGKSWGNAAQWGVALGSDKIPAVGAIAWWAGSAANPYGHVAVVEQVSGRNVFITADNWSSSATGGYTSSGWIPATDPTGYIHLRDGVSASDGTPNVAAVSTGGQLWAKQGGLATNWLNMTSGIASVKISGDNVVALTTSGVLLGKQGGFNTNWLTLTSGIKSFDLAHR